MKWLELKIDAAPAGLEPVSALLEDLGITGLVIDDEGDFQDFLEHNHAYWDYVDDQLMQEKKGLCRITFYLEDSPDGYNALAQDRMALSRVKQEHPEYGRLLLTMENMEDADWENNWKQFYKPMEIGDRLIVIPEWESAGVPEGRVAAVVVYGPCRFFGIFGPREEYYIPWECIQRIGDDIILIDKPIQPRQPPPDRRRRRRY